MAEEELADIVIPEISKDEKILKEGVLKTITLYRHPPRTFMYKYAITDKGMWTRSKRSLLVKPVSVFVPYDDLVSFEVTVLLRTDACIFHPKNGKAGNGIYFDDHKGAVQILETYLKKTEKMS